MPKRIALPILLILLFAVSLVNKAHAQSPTRLQLLLNDTVAQLQLAYRHNLPELRSRYDELAQVVAAWREAPRNETNNYMLEVWLRGTIRSSMPGSQESLPSVPEFVRPIIRDVSIPVDLPSATIAEQATRPPMEVQSALPPSVAQESIEPAPDKTIGDPFGDDPETTE